MRTQYVEIKWTEQETQITQREHTKGLLILESKLYDYQTWQTHFCEKFTRCAKVCGLFFLGCAFGCWLAEQTNSDHMDHVIGVFDLLDLWVIKIKRPMILCARSTSRSNISNMEDTFVEKCTRCAKVCGLFLIDCWLAEQKNCDNLEVIKRSEQTFENRLCYPLFSKISFN